MELRIWCIAVGGAGLLCHFDSSVGHKGSLQGFIGLQAHNFFQALQFLFDIGGGISIDSGNHFSFHIQYAALLPFFFLQTLHIVPKDLGVFCGLLQEVCIPVIGSIVSLDKVSDIHILYPVTFCKTIPFVSHIDLHPEDKLPEKRKNIFYYSLRLKVYIE